MGELAIRIQTPLKRDNRARRSLYRQYAGTLDINSDLTRALVSFQANKRIPFYRWLKYKEAFSSHLVSYFIERFRPAKNAPHVLDPFAGAGTTLTTATKAGWQATGIELIPVGVAAMQARLIADHVNVRNFHRCLRAYKKWDPQKSNNGYRFPHIRITEKAFAPENEVAIGAYAAFLEGIKDSNVRYLFWFACLSILEDISYTRKDGQYLRWDCRSGKAGKGTFCKGQILDFRPTVTAKLEMILEDILSRNGRTYSRNVKIIDGSCLDVLPDLPPETFDLVLTSPPYCNRYDYSRTYALELAFLGYGEEEIKRLRQTLLSATVENRSKRQRLQEEYAARAQGRRYDFILSAFENQKALQEVLAILYDARVRGELNNNNIPYMIENYFFEMNFVVHELARTLRPGGSIVMVNDNVRYHGEEVPVDLILSDFANHAGLRVEKIWVLQRGKGNSSQQMGVYGRNELRKCVYLWRKNIS